MQINFAIFGEQNNGHALLASSGNAAFAAKLTDLTDRPGDPPVGFDWGPIFSGFVFSGYYVFMRIQPDPTVRRAGMVRSIAAYIPLGDIGGVNDLSLLYSHLPSGVGPISPTLQPLDINDNDLARLPDLQTAQRNIALAHLLTASDSNFPILWASPEPYLPAIATLWAQLPQGLRTSFSFYFLFAPEHHTVTSPVIVATLPEFSGRWLGKKVIGREAITAGKLTGAQSWLSGLADGRSFEEALRSYSIELPNFSRLSVIVSFVEMVMRLEALTFSEARKAVYIVAQYSRKNKESAASRAKLFYRFCQLVRVAPLSELLKLQNLESNLVAELIPDLQTAMVANLVSQSLSGEMSSADIAIFETAISEPDHWWSITFLNWLSSIGRELDKNKVKWLFAVAGSVNVFQATIRELSKNKANEALLLEGLPTSLKPIAAENLIEMAERREWWSLHANCLLCFLEPTDVVEKHAAVAKGCEGFTILLSALGLKVLIQGACKTGSPALIAFVGAEIVKDLVRNLTLIPTTCTHVHRVLQSVIKLDNGVLIPELRSRMVHVLENSVQTDASFAELCMIVVERDPSLLLDFSDPIQLISRLPEDLGRSVDDIFCSWLRLQIQSGHPFFVVYPNSFKSWLGSRSVVDWLNQVPAIMAVQAGVTCFRSLPFLTDVDCRRWLVELFTRTSRDRISPAAAGILSEFLASVDFPSCATVVRETAIDFHRADVMPIHENIRYKYQMARAYNFKSQPTSGRLYPVLIVTALPLERKAVIAYLPDATYDSSLLADVAVWPAVNPVYQIFHITSGAGNITVQGAVHRFLKGGVKPRLAFFAGVCGGVKDSDVGDVVFSTKVYYTEGGKEEDDGVKARPAMKETNEDLIQLAIRVSETAWQPIDKEIAQPKATPAVFAASEQVLASTAITAESYQRLKKSYNDTQAVDMEAYGFLKAMQDDGVSLSMVLRGVSDKLKKKEEADAQGSQPLAARNVAAFLFALLTACQPLLTPKKKKRKKKGLIDFLFGA